MKLVLSPDDSVEVTLTQAGKFHIESTFPTKFSDLQPLRLSALIDFSKNRRSWTLRELFDVFGPTFESAKGTPFIEGKAMEIKL